MIRAVALILFAAFAIAQTAVVVNVEPADTAILLNKYAAFEKARMAWESERDRVLQKMESTRYGCGLMFSADFKSAVPAGCPARRDSSGPWIWTQDSHGMLNPTTTPITRLN